MEWYIAIMFLYQQLFLHKKNLQTKNYPAKLYFFNWFTIPRHSLLSRDEKKYNSRRLEQTADNTNAVEFGTHDSASQLDRLELKQAVAVA